MEGIDVVAVANIVDHARFPLDFVENHEDVEARLAQRVGEHARAKLAAVAGACRTFEDRLIGGRALPLLLNGGLHVAGNRELGGPIAAGQAESFRRARQRAGAG